MRNIIVYFVLLLCGVAQAPQKPFLGEQPDWTRLPMPIPIGLWLFNEGAGPRANDLSGEENHGTISSGTLWVGGIFGYALDIEAVGQPVTLTSEITINPGTVIIWAKWSGNNEKDIIGKYDANNRIYLYDLDSVGIEDNSGSKKYFTVQSPTVVAGVWFCIAATYDGTNWRVYKDGIESSNSPIAASYLLVDTIGNAHSSDTVIWDGDIGVTYIFDVVLTADQIARLYQDPFPWFAKDDVISSYVPTAAPAEGGQVIIINFSSMGWGFSGFGLVLAAALLRKLRDKLRKDVK